MSYIGTQPVPQSLQSRQQFTGDGSTTDFATIGGVELYEDVFLNGVRLSRVDNEYSFDGTTLTITPAPANGDTVSIILRNDHSELIALPITDSQGNNVLSESSGTVTLTADEANVGSNALVVDASGNVGINEATPLARLHVKSSGSPEPALFLTNTNADITWGTVDNFQLGVWDGTTFTERMRINTSGNVLVGCETSPSATVGGSGFIDSSNGRNSLYLSTLSTGSQGIAYFWNPNGLVGQIITNGSATSYATSSDYRLKENITEITDGISRIKQLNPSRFNFIADPDKTVDGFLAHEAQEVVPEAVTGTKDAVDDEGNPEYQGVDYGRITPLLTAALKEAIAKIEMLETRIALLEKK
jgi:hypothetical protein